MYRGTVVEDDEWDPMKDAFYSEGFNSYREGPGAYLDRALQPCFRKKICVQKPLCKLYVHKIPVELSEEGLRSMFMKFGVPINVYLSRKPNAIDKTWALVEYATISEGQEAINELNGRPPLNLGVQFARSDEEKERIRREYEEGRLLTNLCGSYDTSYDLPEMESPYPRAIGRGRGIPLFPQPTVQEIYSHGSNGAIGRHDVQTYVTDEDDEIVFRKHIPRGVFSPYYGSMWDPSNSHIMSNVSLTVNSSGDGRRISMGRAVNAPYVESRPRFRKHAYALQESDTDKNGFRVGYCVYCDRPSKFICGRCGAWYCCQNCQEDDWLQHKAKCLHIGAHPNKLMADEHLEKGKGSVRQGHWDYDLQKEREDRTLGMAHVESDDEQSHHSLGSKRSIHQNGRLKRDNQDGASSDVGSDLPDDSRPRRTSHEKTGGSDVKDHQKSSQGFNLRKKDVEMSSEKKRENDERRKPPLCEIRKDNDKGKNWEREQDEAEAKKRAPHKFQGLNQRVRDAEKCNSWKSETDERKGENSLNERGRRGNNGNESWDIDPDRTQAKIRVGQQKFWGSNQRSKDVEDGSCERMRESSEGRGRRPSHENRRKGGGDDDECWESEQSNKNFDVIGKECEAGKAARGKEGGGGERIREEDRGEGRMEGVEKKKEWANERRGNGGKGRGRGRRGVGGFSQRGGSYGGSRSQRSFSDNTSTTGGTPDDDWDADKTVVSPAIPAHTSENAASKEVSSCLYNQPVELTPGKFTEVEIGTVVSPGHFWVQLNENKQDLISILKIMKVNWSASSKAFTPKVGDCCAALFEEFPYRARVLSVANVRAKVFYIDFGNTDMCELVNMRELPPIARNYKAQVLEIVMADGTPEEYLNLPANDVVRIKPVSKKESGAVIVEVEGVIYKEIISPSCTGIPNAVVDSKREDGGTSQDANSHPLAPISNCKKMQWPKSVVELLKEGEFAVCEVYAIELKDGVKDSAILGIAFQGIVKEIKLVLEELHNECLEIPKYPNFRPSVGELIAAFDDDNSWKRAVVINEESNGWIVAFCDTGMVKTLKQIQKMPKDQKFREAPAIAAKCSIVKSLVSRDDLFSEGKMKVGSRLHLNIGARNGGHVMADVGTESQSVFCKVKLEEWIPQGPEPKCVVLSSGDKVQIVSYYNLAAIYVQPADEKSKKNIQRLLQDVSGACTPIGGMKILKLVPSKGTIVGCKFTGDDNFYRALITDVKSPKEIHVSYIDFGNQEYVPLERIYNLPNELKKIPSYAVKIGLKTSNVTQLNKAAATLLHELVLENAELIFVCPDDDLRSCELYTKSGTNLNEKLNKLLEPEISPRESSGISETKPFKMSSLIEEKLPKPPQGENISIRFLILNCPGKCTVIGCFAEDPRIRLVYESFPNDMSVHCEKCPNEPYVPTQLEICIAKFTDGMWYRAFAIDSKKEESSVYFVDFGNWTRVNHKDIRKMVPEFMKVPVLATLCSYKGFVEDTMTIEQERRLKELLKPNSVVTASIWYNSESDDFIVDIPEVTEALKAENLFPHTV